jgi:hypothetical protein
MRRLVAISLAAAWAVPALGQSEKTASGFRPPQALAAIPKESGFGGFVMVGGAVSRVKSNLIAGNDFGDVGEKNIDSIFDEPDGRTRGSPVVNFNIHYTFAEARTQIFLGNRLEDLIRYDLTTQLGVRHEFSKAGTLGASFVFSAIPTEVWKDPYLENQSRKETDRDSRGVRLNWQRIFGTPLRLQYTYRDIDIDKERSGETFLPSNEAKRLRRDGDSHSIDGFYAFRFGGRHTLVPSLGYERENLDGSAVSNDRYEIQLTHTYAGERFAFATNLGYEKAKYDKRNPIYGKTQDDDRYGGSFTVFYDRLFGAKQWIGVGGVGYFKNDSNIDFYEASMLQGFLAAMYHF